MTVAYKTLNCWLLALLVLGSLVMPADSAEAQTQPVLVISVAGADELLADVAYLTESAGLGDFGRMAAMMAQPYTQGLDKTRPIGIVVTSDGGQFRPLGFVPVTDLQAFLSVLPDRIGKPSDAGGGVLQFQGGRGQSVFVKEQGGWAFVGQSAEALQNLPDSPIEQLQGLDKRFGIAIQAHISNVPAAYKQLAMMGINQGMQGQLKAQANESDAQFQLRKKLVQNQVKQMETMFNEIDQITIGWHTDAQAKKTYFEISLTAVAGSKTAKQIAMMSDAKSAFAGLLRPDAALTLNIATQIPQEDIQDTVTMLQSVRDTAKREIQNDADLPDQQARDTAEELLDGLFDVAVETIESGTIDGAATVVLNPHSLTALVGSHVADGSKLEAVVKKLVDLVKDDPSFPGVKFDADEHAGVRFHTLNLDIPEGDNARKLFGERATLALGVGPTSVYLALGQDGIDQLKQAIDQSAKASTTVPPFQLKVAVGRILRFVSSLDENPALASLADAVDPSAGDDNVLVTVGTSDEAAVYRFEVQEGVLRAIGQAVQTWQGMRAGS